MTDKLKSGTLAWQQRQERHYHNSLIGSACMMQAQCNKIMQTKTVTKPAKLIAFKILPLVKELEAALRAGRAS